MEGSRTVVVTLEKGAPDRHGDMGSSLSILGGASFWFSAGTVLRVLEFS